MDTFAEIVFWITKNFDWNSLLLVILITILLIWINKSPELYGERLRDERNENSAQRLQADLYYREGTGAETRENLSWWTEFLVDPTKKAAELSGGADSPDEAHQDMMNKRIQFVMQFGSPRTVKLMSLYMSKLYTKDIDSDGTLVCVSYIIASLKSDYTGKNTLPMDLLRTKFTDFNDHEKKYKGICKTIKRETGVDDHLNYKRLK